MGAHSQIARRLGANLTLAVSQLSWQGAHRVASRAWTGAGKFVGTIPVPRCLSFSAFVVGCILSTGCGGTTALPELAQLKSDVSSIKAELESLKKQVGALGAQPSQTPEVKPAAPQRSTEKRVATITDASGKKTALRGFIEIDYTHYSFMYKPDRSYDKLRIDEGTGTVSLDFDNIKTVTLSDVADKGIQAEIVLQDGTTKRVKLVDTEPEGKGLTGKSDLGDFSIPLRRIRSIDVTPGSKF